MTVLPPWGPIPSGYVRIACTDPSFVVLAMLGEEPPTLSGGVGGWDLVGRPRDVAMTVWTGIEPYALSVAVMLDGFADRRSQEPALRSLLRVARGDRESPPGIVTIEGIPSLPAREWVIESLDYADPIRRVSDFHRTRQPVTIAFREYVRPDYLSRPKTPSKTSSKSTIIIAVAGDTAAKIAKRRKLKSWTILRRLNSDVIRKANQRIPTGTPILVPVTKLGAKKK